LVRIFKTKSADLASKLVITTNTQNKITSRDLHAQDEIQEHIQAEFERRFGIKYERTPNEFADLSRSDSQEIVSNQKIGQSYLAVVRKRPSDASRRQYKVWGDQYDYRHIFNASIFPETYLLTYRIVEYCNARKRQTLAELDDADVKRILVANGTYHLARIISFLWRRGDDWNDLEQIRRDLQKLKDEPDLLAVYYDEALKLLVEVFNSDEQFIQDPSVALKSSKLDDEISNSLYRKRARSTKRTKSKPKK